MKPKSRPFLAFSIIASTWLLYFTIIGIVPVSLILGAGLGHGQEEARLHVQEAAVVARLEQERDELLGGVLLGLVLDSSMTALE